jgi:hypothetical protein
MSDGKDNIDQISANNDSQEEINLAEESSVESSKATLGFLDKILEIVTGISRDDRIKFRKLKDINKRLKHLKYKFYNYKNDVVLPPLGQYFYDLYRMSQNLSRFMDIKNHSKSIKQFIFEIFSNENQKKLGKELDRASINQLLNSTADTKTAIDTIKSKLNQYVKAFDYETIKKINSTYNQIVDLSNIINFDWYYLLHKFDSEITETNFNYKPEFEALDGKYILDELIALSDYFETLDFNSDFKYIFDYIKAYTQDENYIKVLKKIIQYCKILKKDNYLVLIIKLIYKNPYFKPKKFPSSVNVVQDYLNEFQYDVKKIVDDLIKEIKKDRINKLLINIFHTTAILRLKHYSQKLNEALMKKNIAGFKLIDPLNFLKAYLLDFCKGDVKARIDYLIIKGTWATNAQSSEYSRLLDEFNQLSDRVVDFDESCSEDESNGKNLRKLSYAVTHDPNAKMLLSKLIFKIEQEALGLIQDAIRLFNHVNEKLKLLIDDYALKTPKILINFHQIKWDFSDDIPSELSNIYKKNQNFIMLLNFYIKEARDNKPK